MEKVRKRPTHKKVRYLIDDMEWAELMADHFFQGDTEVSYGAAMKFESIVMTCGLTLEQFLDRDWKGAVMD